MTKMTFQPVKLSGANYVYDADPARGGDIVVQASNLQPTYSLETSKLKSIPRTRLVVM